MPQSWAKQPGASEARILGCASKGTNSDDEDRLRALLTNFSTTFVPFDRARKLDGFLACLRLLRAGNFDLFAMEGTGVAVGVAAILGRILWGRRYVVSSGDAIAPFLSAIVPVGAPVFGLYERALYRFSSGFIGWTPYLVGRALTLGAKRGTTAAGWAPFALNADDLAEGRKRIRESLGIPQDAIVFGIAGSLTWSKHYQFSYGADLILAAKRAKSEPVVLIVGDGSAMDHLKRLAGDRLGKTIFLTGRVPRNEVPLYLAAMDLGSLPQTVDGVGSFRYTTKITEYRSARLPVITNFIPMAYDLDFGDIVRLEGDHPRSDEAINALVNLMDTIQPEDVTTLRAAIPVHDGFDRETQVKSVTAFLTDVVRSAP